MLKYLLPLFLVSCTHLPLKPSLKKMTADITTGTLQRADTGEEVQVVKILAEKESFDQFVDSILRLDAWATMAQKRCR